MNLMESYRVVFKFLDSYYWRNKSDELCDLVSSMPLLSNDMPIDSASLCDWRIAVYQTIKSPELCETLRKECRNNATDGGYYDCRNRCYFDEPLKNIDLSSEMIYKSMIAYLRNWASLGTDGTVESLWVQFDKADSQITEWQISLDTVKSNSDNPYFHLIKP